MSGVPSQVEELRQRVSLVAEHLYALDTDPQLSLLRGGGLRGRSAVVAGSVAPLIDGLWQRYPAVKEQVDGLDRAAVPDAGLTSAVASLEADLATVLAAGAQLSDAWRRLVPRMDQAASAMADAEAGATRLGMDAADEPLLVEARRALAALQEEVAADPLSADPAATAAGTAVERAVAQVRELSERQRGLPDALAAARSTLERVRTLVAEGRERLEAARLRVVDTSGLLEPVDPSVVDGDARSIGPWLERLRTEAAEGDWRAAWHGLERWRVVAEGVLGNAEAVVAANGAPVERRNQLRGLLDAYQAKAGAGGLAERPEIVALLREAKAALLTAPADLDAGEQAVMALGRAITSAQAVRP